MFILSTDGNAVCSMLRKTTDLRLPPVSLVVNGAFRKSTIRTLFIPSTIREIGESAFLESGRLEDVIFESGSVVSSIGRRCFAECKNLSHFSFGGARFLRAFSAQLFKGSKLSSVSVPDSVRTIESECFSNCANLVSLSFGKGSFLKRICNRAFEGTALAHFEGPMKLVALGSGVFSSCSKLASVVLPYGLRFIGSECFSSCGKRLNRVDLPETLSIMESNAVSDHCIVHMKSEDSEIVAAFDRWKLDRKKRFINPRTEFHGFIRGAMLLCEGGLIGRGGQGSVKLKESIVNGEILAVKTVMFGNRITEDRWEELKDREYQLQAMRSSCLVRLKGFYFDDQRRRMTIGMEYVSCSYSDASLNQTNPEHSATNVTLKDVVERNPVWWTNKAKATAILGIAHGIDYLHAKGFIHRDLKPSNILFDEQLCPKICDFDVARREAEDSSATMTMSVGTQLYMAPEVASGHYNHKADLFSFGCILYEIFEGTNSLVSFIRGSLSSNKIVFTSSTPLEMQPIIESCLCVNPEDRCSFLDEDHASLLSSLWDPVRANMGLDANELEYVEHYVQDIECEECDSHRCSDSGSMSGEC